MHSPVECILASAFAAGATPRPDSQAADEPPPGYRPTKTGARFSKNACFASRVSAASLSL